jgi:uncharacterized membrane protein YfcA
VRPDEEKGGRLRYAGIGLASGLLSGLLGVGGGIVIVPLLVLASGMGQHRAHATSLAAIVPIAAVGAAAFAIEGEIDVGVALLFATGSIVGAPWGGRVMAGMSEGSLRLLFGVLVLVVGVTMMFP